jgi:ferric-dicitrate binding protein FerR (iron transport regulator)
LLGSRGYSPSPTESLAVILNEFTRHNPVVFRLDDPALKELRLSARFSSDNVQGFIRLLESEFRVQAKRASTGEIVLRAAP